jgi:hypothetical protein
MLHLVLKERSGGFVKKGTSGKPGFLVEIEDGGVRIVLD